jgi:ribosome-binding protein aMBF1 (putative translation factor)
MRAMARLSKQERRQVTERAIERLRERLAGAQDGWLFAQIAKQVAERRRELGLSQAELAEVCGTTQSAIARLESGGRPPRIDTLLKLAHALDCELHVELRSGGAKTV